MRRNAAAESARIMKMSNAPDAPGQMMAGAGLLAGALAIAIWRRDVVGGSIMRLTALRALALGAALLCVPALAGEGPDLIFRKSTVFKLLTPNDKLATYAIDDPLIDGVACHYTVPEKGGLAGMFGVAEEVSDISLACRQYGPIRFKQKFAQGDVVFSERRSLIFKKMQIVRGCDAKRNVLVYMVYSDKLIEGSPKNSTSAVPVMPWGTGATAKCADWLEK
jgi:CreA protein